MRNLTKIFGLILLLSALLMAQNSNQQAFARKSPILNNHPPSLITNPSFSDGVQEAWVSHYASRMVFQDDFACAIAIDGYGNIYVAGSSLDSSAAYSYSIVKYNPDGVHQWLTHYNRSKHFDDMAAALAVDGGGNVYVTGYSHSSSTRLDYTTVKYNSNGNQMWVVHYNGPANQQDEAQAIALDSDGNVYVTGRSYGLGTDQDYATVKYNADGVEQWIARYNGPGNSFDWATAIAIDSTGNVYVTGRSNPSGVQYDYATVKYDSNGNQLWVARYNGSANWVDEVKAMALDGEGNVYVTGRSLNLGTGYDYATVKYNAAGVQQWAVIYNGSGNDGDSPAALALDNAGNIFVTGTSTDSLHNHNFATVKYNTLGAQQWVAHYDGPENNLDEAIALKLDDTGNIYVSGRSLSSNTYYDYSTVKYNAAGSQQWVVSYNGPGNDWDSPTALAVDNSSNIYITGQSEGSGTELDYATVKYNNAGVQQWVVRYNGLGSSDDEATTLGVDVAGNVYVAGTSNSSITGKDYATVMYDPSGVQQWATRYDGPTSLDDEATALKVDRMGYVYITGSSQGSSTDLDYATLKYNNMGLKQWVARYNGTGHLSDQALALALDHLGNVYVTGFSTDSLYDRDYTTVKYGIFGIKWWPVKRWIARYDGSGNGMDVATALFVDGKRNVYVTGSSEQSNFTPDYVTVKYDITGEQQWVANYNGPGNDWDSAIGLAVDDVGNVYVTGFSRNSGINGDYATVKYNSSGAEQWVARYDGPANLADQAIAMAIDGIGNVYVTGYSTGSGTSLDYATVKYDSLGVEQWVARYNGPANLDDQPTALALDGSGNVYVTGCSFGSSNSGDYATVKYNGDGIQQWVARYDGRDNGYDVAAGIALDSYGNILVTGFSSEFNGRVYTTIKYIQIPTGLIEIPLEIPQKYQLLQNYPNPFNPITTINYQLPRSVDVKLIIYNVLGQKVKTLVDQRVEAGYHNVKWDSKDDNGKVAPTGIYVYRLTTREFVQSRKMLLIR
jgi:uncharacterized delta-60 repeat protein